MFKKNVDGLGGVGTVAESSESFGDNHGSWKTPNKHNKGDKLE
jgi:hypothetical protein